MTVWVMEETGSSYGFIAGVAESLDVALKHVHDRTDQYVTWEEPHRSVMGGAIILRGVIKDSVPGLRTEHRFVTYRFTQHDVKGQS